MNNSKQAVLSIVGIAILVIAVVGVSFAFFTYSRQGTTNNVITTGEIVFDSDVNTATARTLTNKFPQTDTDGKANQSYNFEVHGNIPTTANDVYYKVAVVKGDTPDGYDDDDTFDPTEVSIYVTTLGAPTTNCADTSTVISKFATGHALSDAVETTAGEQIAYGMIDNKGVRQEHDYTLTMWINNTVTISDTDSNADYRAHKYIDADVVEASNGALHDTDIWTEMPSGSDPATEKARKVYSDMWYSLKVNITASDTETFVPAS